MSAAAKTPPSRAWAVWRTRLGSAFRTALACAIIGCTTLYGPSPLKTQLTFPAFSYVTAILIVSDATLGDTIRGCCHALCATVQVVPVSILSLWVVGPANFSAGVAGLAVALGSFLVALPESTPLMAKRIAFGQIVIVYVAAVIHGDQTGAFLHPIHVASSTGLGALASVLALLLPYPRLAYFEIRKLCRLYAENASQRISLYMKAFSAQDDTTALDAISQAKPFAETGAKLLQSIKLIQEGVLWERPQIRFLKPRFIKPGVRLQAMEIPIRGMEMALTSSPSFPFKATTAPEAKGELFNKFLESLPTINPNCKDLTASFFLFCIKLLQDDSKARKKPSVAFIFSIIHHIMICDHQYKNKDAKKIGKEAMILIVKHS